MKIESFLKSKKGRPAILLGAVAIILIIALTNGIKLSALNPSSGSYPLPSFQGLHFIFVGFQPANSQTVYTANSNATLVCPYNPASCSFIQSVPSNGAFATTGNGQYSWQYQQTFGSVQMCTYQSFFSKCAIISITPSSTAPSQIGTLSYNVFYPLGSSAPTTSYQVDGVIMQTNLQLTLAAQPGSDANTQFKNDILWFAVYSAGYNNVYPVGNVALPNGTLTATWAAPLLTEYTGAQLAGANGGAQPNNYATTPGINVAYAPLTLFNIPQTSSTFTTLVGDPSSVPQVPQILQNTNVLAPDTRMQEFGYFPVILNNFGAYGCAYISTCYNSLTLNLYVDTLTLGRYIYTNPVTNTQTTQTYNCQGPLCGISNWFANPWNLFGLGAVGIFILFGIVFIVAVVFIGRVPTFRRSSS